MDFEIINTIIFFIFSAVFLVLILSTTIVIVPQARAYVIERFGKYNRTMHPGLNFRIPFVETIREKVLCQVHQLATNVALKLSDEAFVNVPVSIMFSVTPETAHLFVYRMNDPEKAMNTWLSKEVRSTVSGMTLPQMYSDRSTVSGVMMKAFTDEFKKFGVTLEDFVVDAPIVNNEIIEASNRVIAARRLQEAAAFEAEAKRTLLLGEAKAESESQVLRAEGISKARKILAEGVADSVKDAAKSGLDEAEVMSMLIEMARLDTIRTASENGKFVVMDLRSQNSVKPTIEL